MISKKLPLIVLTVLFSCTSVQKEKSIEDLSLEHFRPQSVYRIPRTNIEHAAFTVIDMHSHDYAENQEDIDRWVATMKKIGIEKTVILSTQTGEGFDEVVIKYSKYPEEFELWCGIDFTAYDSDPNWTEHAIKELVRCHERGAKGVGELGDKGEGLLYSKPTKAYGLHIDSPDMKPILEKCAELGMPVNIHVAEPKWMYEKMDSTNDGLMNAYKWRVDMSKKGILDHGELIHSLENAVRDNPNTTFIACHFANCSYDLSVIGAILDKYPNLYLDNAARYAETAPIPRYVEAFYEKYQDRIVYGTDMGMDESMYKVTLRILESEDEHFYEINQFSYHWPLYGFGLPNNVLKKIYNENATKIFQPN